MTVVTTIGVFLTGSVLEGLISIECPCDTHTTNIVIYSLTLGACNEAVHLHRDTLSDITQTLMCFDGCSGFSVIRGLEL